MNVDASTAERIGASWLRAALAPVSELGRRADDAAVAFGPGDEAAAQACCARIVELAERLDGDGTRRVRAALGRAPDPTPIVARARLGDPLDDVDFFLLARFADALEATALAWQAAGGPGAEHVPRVPALATLLAPGRRDGGFYLADAFASQLGALRVEHAAADERARLERARLAAHLEPVLGARPDGDEFIAMRDEVPVPPPGVRIVREAPAYFTFALVLDAGALAAEAACDAAARRVAAEEAAIRRALGQAVANAGEELRAAADALGELDRTLARVLLVQSWGGCVPVLTAGRFAFEGASFVPLREALAQEGLRYTPLDLDLRGTAVLTGPNMGGKSAALATCGFLALCVAHGVPPPARRAVLPLCATVAWIGGDAVGDRTRLLSAFGAEVVRAHDVLALAERPALVLIDEFARTTGPREGRALLVALVEALARRGAFALAATHFEGVARDAGLPHLAIAGLGERVFAPGAARDVHAALDAVAQAMDYRIVAVGAEAASPSDALALAELLGLDAAIVERARALFTAAD